MTDEIQKIDQKHFTVGDTVRVTADGASATLEITEVSNLPNSASSNREPFSIVLCGELNTPLGQGTYQFSLDDRLEVPLFMVPIGKNEQGFLYEVIFN